MNLKKAVLISSAMFMVVVLMILQPVVAWFFYYRTSFLMVTGDVELSVQGWSQAATDESILEYHAELVGKNTFHYKDVSMDNFIAFKFEVTNKKTKDAVLSMRLSDFSEYIFDHFDEYRKQIGLTGEIDSELEGEIFRSAEVNTAKLATSITDVYYIDIDGTKKTLDFVNQYTWLYGFGKNIFENIFLPGVKTDHQGKKTESSVELYFVIRNNHDSRSTEDYRKWLFGFEDTDGTNQIGYGQEYLAHQLGYTYSALSNANKDLIDDYLLFFMDQEFKSIATVGDDGLPIISLNIRYFEFIGDSFRT